MLFFSNNHLIRHWRINPIIDDDKMSAYEKKILIRTKENCGLISSFSGSYYAIFRIANIFIFIFQLRSFGTDGLNNKFGLQSQTLKNKNNLQCLKIRFPNLTSKTESRFLKISFQRIITSKKKLKIYSKSNLTSVQSPHPWCNIKIFMALSV